MKEKLHSFRDATGWYLSPILYFLSLFWMDQFFRMCHSESGGISPWNGIPIFFSICWSVIFTFLSVLLRGKLKKILMSCLLAVFVIFYLANATIFHVTGSFLSFSDLAFAETGVAFVSIQYLAFSPWIWLSVLFCTALGALAVFMAPARQSSFRLSLYSFMIALALSSIGIAMLHSAYYDSQTHFKWTDQYTPESKTAIYTEFSNPNECYRLCGTYHYLFRSFTAGINDYFRIPALVKGLDEYFSSRSETAPANEMTGALEDWNAIVIMMESIDTWMVTPEIMPNLYALQEESIDFENHYTPLFLSAGTFNTEFALNTGFYLPTTGTGARTYATNVYPNSLPNVFRNGGYNANSYHALDGSYYNRENVHVLWGYEHFYDHGGMNLEGDYHCDSVLMEAYDQFCPAEGKFLSYLITYSGHGPYNDEEDPICAPHMARAKSAAESSGAVCEDEDTWSQYVISIAHAMETDAFIGSLVEQMRADGSIEDTALILFGDHYSKYLTDEDFLHALKGTTDTNDLCHTPFFIYANGQKVQSVSKVTSSVDMLPTIANLFGLEYNARYLVGNDAFGTEGGFVAFKDYSYLDQDLYWNPDLKIQETEEIARRKQEVRSLLTASWNTVKTNYFQRLMDQGVF